MQLAIYLFITGLFVVLGIVFSLGKGTFLIAGYNTASAAEKAKIDEKKLCKAMAKLMFALAVCWLVIASSVVFKTTVLLWIGLVLFFVVITVGLIRMNTGNRIKKGISDKRENE